MAALYLGIALTIGGTVTIIWGGALAIISARRGAQQGEV